MPFRLHPLCLVTASLLAALPVRSFAASASSGPDGTQLLQAELPGNTPVTRATCEQLTRAVTLATHTHRAEAVAILTAALTRGTRKDAPAPQTKLPCTWVAALLHAAVVAAPDKASSLMEVAGSLYPDCADTLQKAVELFDDKTVVDDKNGPARVSPAAAGNGRNSADPNAADPDGLNPDDPETRGSSLVGGSFGPGFPGAPGFVGSPPAGGVALPPPASAPVTAVLND